jgi:tetratricopeptide (TPR) repeat protein
MNDRLDTQRLHVGIAEQGKLEALAGRHDNALAHYREALRLAAAVQAPGVVARHYLLCVFESLEHKQEFAALAALVEQALAAPLPDPSSQFERDDRALLYERLAIARLRSGETAAARAALDAALALSGPHSFPLAAWLDAVLKRGLTVTPVRLAEAQRQHGYFTVRPGTADHRRAISLPIAAQGTGSSRHGRFA